jgi:hypothetical protein
MKIFVIGILTTLLYSVSYAEVEFPQMVYGSPQGNSCESENGRKAYLKSYAEALYSVFLARIENVPPDEDAYLRQEHHDAHRPPNIDRVKKVKQRPFFPAWHFREMYRELIEEIETPKPFYVYGHLDVYSGKEKEIAYLLEVAEEHYFLVDSLVEYNIYDSKRPKPYLEESLSSQLDDSFILDKILFTPNINALIICALRY